MNTRIAITLSVTCLIATPARAETPATPASQDLLLAVGALRIDASLMVELSVGQQDVPRGVGDPISLNPDFRYGLAPSLELAFVHSAHGLTGFWDGPGGGLCAIGAACVDVYGGPAGALASYQFAHGALAITGQGGLVVRKFGDSLLVGARAALKLRWRSGPLDFISEPGITAGFNGRQDSQPPNREKLNVPLELRYALTATLMLYGQTGLRGFLVDLADQYQVPVSLGAMYRVGTKLDVGAFVGFGNVASEGAFDLRGLNLHASYRL